MRCVLSEIEWIKCRQIIRQQLMRMMVLQSNTPKIVARLIPRTNPAAPPTSDKNCSHAKMKIFAEIELKLFVLTIVRIFDVGDFTLMRNCYHGCYQGVEAWPWSFQNKIHIFVIAKQNLDFEFQCLSHTHIECIDFPESFQNMLECNRNENYQSFLHNPQHIFHVDTESMPSLNPQPILPYSILDIANILEILSFFLHKNVNFLTRDAFAIFNNGIDFAFVQALSLGVIGVISEYGFSYFSKSWDS